MLSKVKPDLVLNKNTTHVNDNDIKRCKTYYFFLYVILPLKSIFSTLLIQLYLREDAMHERVKSVIGYITQTIAVNYLGHGWNLSLSRPPGNVVCCFQIDSRSGHCASGNPCCAAVLCSICYQTQCSLNLTPQGTFQAFHAGKVLDFLIPEKMK